MIKKKRYIAVYKIQWDSCQKPNSLTKSPIEVHFSRSNIFLLYFCEKKILAEVLFTHAEEKWLCRILSFYEKRKTKQHKQNFFKKMETYGFCKLQTKKCEEISTARLRHFNYLHSSSIYPHKRKNKTERGRKSKVKIIATITSWLKLVALAILQKLREGKQLEFFEGLVKFLELFNSLSFCSREINQVVSYIFYQL